MKLESVNESLMYFGNEVVTKSVQTRKWIRVYFEQLFCNATDKCNTDNCFISKNLIGWAQSVLVYLATNHSQSSKESLILQNSY